MNPKQWNTAMFSTIVALLVIAVPFFSHASDFGLGDFDDFGDGDFDGFGDGDFDDFGSGDFDSFGSGDFDSFGQGDFSGPADTPFDGFGGWDPFDDDLGPFGDLPGNPPGDDIDQPPIIPPPIIPPPVIPPTDNNDDSSQPEAQKDYLKIFIHQIFMHDPFSEQAGNTVELRITFENTGTKKLENVKVIVGIPDLAVRTSFGPMDLGKGKKTTGIAFLELPEYTQPGVYPVRMQIYSEDAQRIVHREIEVVDYS